MRKKEITRTNERSGDNSKKIVLLTYFLLVSCQTLTVSNFHYYYICFLTAGKCGNNKKKLSGISVDSSQAVDHVMPS